MRFARMVKNSLKVYFFYQFVLHGMSLPCLMFSSTLIFKVLTYWSGTAWFSLGFDRFYQVECVWTRGPLRQFPNLVFCGPKQSISIELTLSGLRIAYCLLTVKSLCPLNKHLSSCGGMFIKTKSMSIKTKAIWQRLEHSTSL